MLKPILGVKIHFQSTITVYQKNCKPPCTYLIPHDYLILKSTLYLFYRVIKHKADKSRARFWIVGTNPKQYMVSGTMHGLQHVPEPQRGNMIITWGQQYMVLTIFGFNNTWF